MNADFLPFAHSLADAAGAIIRPYFGTALSVDVKADHSPVSIADREAEAAIRALVAARFPEHGIYGEEYGQQSTSQRYTWVIDPIDGTRAFLAGKKEWGTLIALCEDGVPILGILDQPVTGERWVGMRDTPSTYTVTPSHDGVHLEAFEKKDGPRHKAGVTHLCRSRPCPSLADAALSTTSKNHFTPPQARAFIGLAEACGEVIADGDCYAYGLLACGLRDLVADAGLKPYDILALAPIIQGAGGIITGWDGAAITLTHYATALAGGNAALHAAARGMLA
ncbi:MAG: inositol monophosphatase family protein [Pseudomonadota bacterium]